MRFPRWAQRVLFGKVADDGGTVRHRVAHGGRGSAKSRSFGQAIIARCCAQPERVLCAREFQTNIRDSVKRLLDDVIHREGLGVLGNGFFISTDKEIRGRNGSLITFMGMHRNAQGVRSLEGYTIAWVEEAQVVSQESIDALTPTIRQEGSEIWWSYNPHQADDPVDVMFRGQMGAPPGSIVQEVNFDANPWFPQVLRREMEFDRGRDPDKYAHKWLGRYLQHSQSRVFHNWHVRPFETPDDAVLRFGADWGFATDPTVLVRCFIGRYENGQAIADTDGDCLFVDQEAYEIGCPIDDTPALFGGTDWSLEPRWDNDDERPGIEGATRWEICADSARPETIAYMRARGFNMVPAVKGAGSIEEGVEFLKAFNIYVHPRCFHTQDELTHYRYKVDKPTGKVLPVLADKNNNTIDALRYALEAVRRAASGKIVYGTSGPREMERVAERMNELAGHGARAVTDKGGTGFSAPSDWVGVL